MSLPLISVLMPSYNVDKYISASIECILNQTYENWELLIADDASTDGTKKIIDSYKDQRIYTYHNKKNIGYLETWNNLISKAKGSFITFLDADDLCSNDRLVLLLETLLNNREIGLVGSNYNRINTEGVVKETSNFPLTHSEIYDNMPEYYCFIGSALMIRREVYETIGAYNSFFNRMGVEDLYWGYLVMEKFKMCNLKEPLYSYRFSEHSVTGNIANNPSKINAPLILKHLINQRRYTGTDDIESGNIQQLQNMLNELNAPFVENPSYYYYYVSRRRFYEGHKMLSIKLMIRAILRSPWIIKYYRDLFYFLRN